MTTCNHMSINELPHYNGSNSNNEKCDYIELKTILSSDELYINNSLSNSFYGSLEDNIDELNVADKDKARLSDRHEEDLNGLFSILQHRHRNQDLYPFDVDDKRIKLKHSLTEKQKIYLILLCCANLKFFRDCQPILTNEFELITHCAIKNFLPSFEVKKMGYKTDYTGNTKTKLKKLAKEIYISTYDKEIDKLPNKASKEKGVDLIAWHGFQNQVPNTVILLIQCACGKNIDNKKHEPSNYEAYLRYGDFSTIAITSLSTPHASETHEYGDVESKIAFTTGPTLFFDRMRLLELINVEKCRLLDDIEQSMQLIDRILIFRQGPVS